MIPADRPAAACLAGYLREIASAVEKNLVSESDIAVVVVDDGTDAEYAVNADAVERTCRRCILSDVATFHIGPEATRDFLASITGGDAAAAGLFEKHGRNYGRIGNILSLIALSFGTTFIHRRDSDTVLHTDGERISSPLEAELLFFSTADPSCSMVGSNYNGQPDIDISLLHDRPQSIVQVYSLVGMSETAIREKLEPFQPRFTDEICTGTAGDALWPEMGNIAYRDIFRSVALPPHERTLGTDYLFLHCCDMAGSPVTLHNQRVDHLHSTARRTASYYKQYYAMLSRCIDYYTIYGHLFGERLQCGTFTPIDFLDKLRLLADRLPYRAEERVERLRRFAELFTCHPDASARDVGSVLVSGINRVLAENDCFLHQHIALQKRWESLADRASHTDPDAFFVPVEAVAGHA